MKRAVLLVFTLLFFQEVESMSLLGVGKTCVFSEVKVRLLLDGKPVANQKVIRQWEWNERRTDEAITDENGYASFPAVYESSIAGLLPIELVIGRQLSVDLQGRNRVFWSNAKRKADENAEYGGSAFHVTCELNGKEELIEDYGSLMVTTCKL